MTFADLGVLLAQYHAGLEAEIALLRRLHALAEREREVTHSGSFAGLEGISDARDALVASLVTIEAELKPVRQMLVVHRARLATLASFEEVVRLHGEAGRLVADIVTSDSHSLSALKEAESSRRFATQALEAGESTLAAYRRVVAPPLASATLVNRRG